MSHQTLPTLYIPAETDSPISIKEKWLKTNLSVHYNDTGVVFLHCREDEDLLHQAHGSSTKNTKSKMKL